MNQQTKIGIILIALFILALCLRLNMAQYGTSFEPDQAYEQRMAQQIITNGHVLNPDLQAYYQLGGAPQTFQNPLWTGEAYLYQGLFGWNIGFNQTIFNYFANILPAIFGALTCIVLFFLGKAVSNGNKFIGIVATFMGAVVPAYVYRTMVGAQSTNSWGFIPLTFGLLFLIWAFNEKQINKKSLFFMGLSGLSFAVMVSTWSTFLVIPLILLGFWFYRTVSSLMIDKDKSIVSADILHFIVIFFIFWGACILCGFNWINSVASFMSINSIYISMFTAIVLVGGTLLYYFRPNLNESQRKVVWGILVLVFIGIVIGVTYFTTLTINTNDPSTLGSLVGEQSHGSNFFLQKFNIFNLLIPLCFVSAVILFIWKWREYEYMPMLLIGFTIFFVMSWLVLKFCYDLGFGLSFAAIIVGMLCYELWNIMKEKNKLELKLLFIPALCILLFGISACGIFIADYAPQTVSDPSLAMVIQYFDSNIPNGANLLNSWNYGHIITANTKMSVSSDNRNYSPIANAQFSQFENDSNSTEAYKIIKDMNTDYILLGKSDFYALRVNEFYIAGKVDGSLGVDFTKPLIQIVECGRNGTILSCNGNNFDESQIPKSWVSVPTQFYNGQYPLFIYLYKDSLVILNAAANNTNLAKVFFGTSETDKFYSRAFETPAYLVLKVNK